MLVVFDIDGTIDAFPRELQSMMQALRGAGHTIHVATGTEDDTAGPDDLQEKAALLTSLGCGECYDQLALIEKPHDENKAKYLKDVGASVLIDNNKDNAKAAAGICLVLVPWQSREG